ncbi:MAG: endolytic transglycosylase MltG [bacterium]
MSKFQRLLKVFRIIFWVCFACLLICGAGAFFLQQVITPAGEGPSRKVVIERGDSPAQIAENLKREGLIKSPFAFRLLVRLAKVSDRLQAGKYIISPRLSTWQIILQIRNGEVIPPQKITIPEGLTSRDIVAILEKRGVFAGIPDAGDRFLRLVKEKNYEGYLFPETYEFPDTDTPEAVMERMKALFDQVALPLWKTRQKGLPVDFSGAVILASLVEREACLDRERPIIAGVYYNRLRKKMTLDCDATIQFALGDVRESLTLEDLKVDSPYNTYSHPGLPPGPIANPGRESLKAAMNPASVPYLYYVLNEIKGDGSHSFSVNYKDHLTAISKYMKR